jgi:hypothetical protein
MEEARKAAKYDTQQAWINEQQERFRYRLADDDHRLNIASRDVEQKHKHGEPNWMPLVRRILGDSAELRHMGCILSLPDSDNQVTSFIHSPFFLNFGTFSNNSK